MRRLLITILFGSLAPISSTAQSAADAVPQPPASAALTTGGAVSKTETGSTSTPSSSAGRPALSFGIDEAAEQVSGPVTLSAGSYAVLHTSEGDILVRLFQDKAPKTVENFIGLATGTKPWKHPVTMAGMNSPLYNNTTIYKTVENALLYSGDPINRGVGDPGFTLPPEFSPELKFDEPGMLAMDLSGSEASGSRWILALRSFPDYTGRYPIFGKVVAGMDVARAISRKPARRPTVPLDPVLVSSIEIIQIPPGTSTTASYSTEDGRRFVTIEKDFQPAAAAATPAPAPADSATTASDEATTEAEKSKAPEEKPAGGRRSRK